MEIRKWWSNLWSKVNPPHPPVNVGRVTVEFELTLPSRKAIKVIEGGTMLGFGGEPWVYSAEFCLRDILIKKKFICVNVDGAPVHVNINTISSYKIIKTEEHFVTPR